MVSRSLSWPKAAAIAFVVLAAVALQPQPTEASTAAKAVAISAGAVAVLHGVLSVVVPNPVTPITSIFYGCIALGATIYDAATDPPPGSPPTISRIVSGPITDRNMATGEYVAGGNALEAAPAGRLISIVGSNFSFKQDENAIAFGGQPAVVSPLSSNTVLSTAVPFVQGSLPAAVQVQVTVNGVTSAPFRFMILPPVRETDAPGQPSKSLVTKLKSFSTVVQGFDWNSLLAAENPNLAGEKKAQALMAADKMVQCARQLSPSLSDLETRLATDVQMVSATDTIVKESPEINTLLDAALAMLGSPSTSSISFVAGWNLVAVPAGTILPSIAGSLYTWQAGDTTYEVLANGTLLKAGLGYWAYFSTQTSLTLPSTGVQYATVQLPANQYVMIGNPGNTPATVTGADVVYIYDPAGGYTQTTTLPPGRGGWAFSAQGGALTIRTGPR